MTELFDIAGQFRTNSISRDIFNYGTGHIHDTYLVKTESSNQPDYILQKINTEVFRDADALMFNIDTVTSHLFQKLGSFKDSGKYLPLELIRTVNDTAYLQQDDACWRMFVFIDGSTTFDQFTKPKQAFEAGRAIGKFQYLLTDLDIPLKETIPGFHDLGLRLETFYEVCKRDRYGRERFVRNETGFVEMMHNRMKPFLLQMYSHHFPLRVTHNDTKINNILFDSEDNAICLIDLDTVMPGYVFYDFGDAIRTLANAADEDENDLSKVKFNVALYRSFRDGYLDAAEYFLTETEKEWLPFSVVYMTFIIGLRFLTDYLAGDVYYKTSYPEHNLARARCQFELIRKMENRLF